MSRPAIISLSGGIGSWYAARWWVDHHGTDNVHLLFADTKIEDEDLYRFLPECADDLGIEITWIAEGRTPWEVFKDKRFIGNTRADLCSRVLKREVLHKWVKDNTEGPCDIIVGIDFTEEHRLPAIRYGWETAGVMHEVHAPLCWRPEQLKDDAFAALLDRGIEPPRLYKRGFPHNNCGGFCVKAGQAQFARLLATNPELYENHEQQEQETRVVIGSDVAILRDRRGGETKPMTMKTFRERIEANPADLDKSDWGGSCSCFSPQLPFTASESQYDNYVDTDR